ncbi:hypothetical protein [Erythrobacter ani]|uniref:Type II secretion system protein GspC N-terminal domain-containing protein n=1 Tax=Erythrobacter ani TaxID=2827235 RepID=A0ABS6SQ31_9SPHN|nr:hypothetical protein [Erythrobacter ani]MBV7266498.1 hypothetical protein [Erythrobacter ani]
MEETRAKSGVREDKVLFACLALVIVALIAGTSLPYLIEQSNSVPSLVSPNDAPPLSENASAKEFEPEPRSGAGARTAQIDGADSQNSKPSQPAIDPALARTAKNEASARAPIAIGDASLASIAFDLGEQPASAADVRPVGGDLIEVRKSLINQGTNLGSMTVTIDQNARIFVRGDELKSLLEQSELHSGMPSQLASSELVSFQQVRDAGIDIRYDPIDDQIVLHP